MAKRTNNSLQNTTGRETRPPLKTGCDFMCSGRKGSSCSTSGTCRVALLDIVYLFVSIKKVWTYHSGTCTSSHDTLWLISESVIYCLTFSSISTIYVIFFSFLCGRPLHLSLKYSWLSSLNQHSFSSRFNLYEYCVET